MRLWLWLTLALGSAEERLGLGFELLRLRWDAGCVDDWSRGLEVEAHRARLDAEVERLLRRASDEWGGPA
ncbi:hypothetical protein ACFVIM_15220 [Streptomyces sp. NPDC057638]|uniref:hypothetical protein n=1 Tax=Streptomyces sp. NPDC057638 TaxID=3346190 RepID=UPI0036B6B83C